MHILFVMPYHNNLHDTLEVLSRRHKVKLLTIKSYHKPTHLAPPVDTYKTPPNQALSFLGSFPNPTSFYRHLPSQNSLVILKHLHISGNLLLLLISRIKHHRVIIVTQHITKKHHLPYLIWLRFIAGPLINYTNSSVLAVSQSSYDIVKKHINNTHYIPACINSTRFKPTTSHSHDPNTLKILCIAKYTPRKNIGALIKAIKGLTKEHPQTTIKLTVLGPITDHSEHEHLASLINNLSLNNNITLLKDHPPDKLPSLYSQADIFILPSFQEPLGYTILEAMSSCLPIITTTDVGASSYVEPNHNGYLISGSPESIIKAINNFFTNNTINTKKLEKFGNASLNIIKKNHSPAVFLDKFQKIL